MEERATGANRRERFGLYIVLLGCYIHFLYSMYPRRLDMHYEHLVTAVEGGTSGVFDVSSVSIAGSKIISLATSQITNIPHQELSMLPLLLVPLVLLSATVFRAVFHGDNAYLLILIAYLLPVSYPPTFTGGCHELGLVLLLSMVSILLIYSNRSLPLISVTTILLFIALIINYISYKITFITIIFLLSLFGLICLYHRFPHKNENASGERYGIVGKPNLSVLGVVLIPVIIGFALNQFFYDSFVPVLENSMHYSSGLERLLQNLEIGAPASVDNPSLTPYYDTSSAELYFLAVSRFILIVASLPVFGLIIARKFLRKEKITSNERIFLALTVSATAVLVIYNLLGNFETTYLVFCGLMGYGLLYVNLKRFRTHITTAIIVLSVISVGYTCVIIYEDAYAGHRDYNDDSYMYPPYRWVASHFDLQNTNLVSDRFTGDYFIFQRYKEKGTKDLGLPSFRTDDLLLLLEPQQVIEGNHRNKYYIINNKLEYFVIDSWYQLKSWELIQDRISHNPHINEIYSTGAIRIVDSISTNSR